MKDKAKGTAIAIITLLSIILIQLFINVTIGIEHVNICLNNFSFNTNFVGIILLFIIVFLIRKKLDKNLVYITIISVFIFQNLFLNLMDKIFVPEDISDDLTGVVIFPLLVITVIIFGIYIDILKNRHKLNNETNE